MTPTVTLMGQVVRLEPLTRDHINPLVLAATEQAASYSFTAVPESTAEAAAYVEAALTDQHAGAAVPFAVVTLQSARVVGSTRFLDLSYWPRRDRPDVSTPAAPSVAEIGGTWLAASAQGAGINTEAKLLMLTHAFDEWRVERVTLKCDVCNTRSRRAIERIGATFEGVRRAHQLAVDGTVRDTAYYSIVAAEWPAVRHRLHALLAHGVTADMPESTRT